jgi:hypothetical protein
MKIRISKAQDSAHDLRHQTASQTANAINKTQRTNQEETDE